MKTLIALIVTGACLGSLIAAEEKAAAGSEVQALSGVPGGLCVLFERGDGRTAADLARGGKFLIHALQPNTAAIPAIRKRMADEGLAEFVSVDAWATPDLPYEKNHVNLLVAEDFPALAAKGLSVTEIVRVLTPLGVACLGGVPATERAQLVSALKEAGAPQCRWAEKDRPWLIAQKPYPKEMGTWTHSRHGADGNPVADDTYLAAANQIQWITAQAKSAQYGELNCTLVGGGRAFTFFSRLLVARDAGSGVILWTMPLTHPLGGRVAMVDGDLCMPNPKVTRYGGEQALISGATGEVIRSFGMAMYGPLYEDGTLLYGLMAYDTATGKLRWNLNSSKEMEVLKPAQYEFPHTSGPYQQPATVMAQGRIYYRNAAGELVVLDAKSGDVICRKGLRETLGGDFVIHFAFGDKVLLRSETREKQIGVYSDKMVAPTEVWKGVARFTAVSGKDGAIVWTHDIPILLAPHYHGQVFKAANRIWLTRWNESYPAPETPVSKLEGYLFDPQPGIWEGLDPETGKVLNTFTAPERIKYHCYRVNATDRYWTGSRPYYFMDWKTGKVEGRFGALRPGCSSQGHFAAQGLFFGYGGTGCGCMRTVMAAQAAFSADGTTWDGAVPKEEHPVETGPGKAPADAAAANDDWPMYRCNMARSTASSTALPDGLTLRWERKLVTSCAVANPPLAADWALNIPFDDPVTQPVVASGRVFTGLVGTKQIVALEAKTGKVEWTHHLAARIDTPPTIHKGLCLVGCHDGWVYAFRTDTGELVWRTRAAPADRRLVAYGQLESTWPVVGGVLVVGDTAYALAGRTTEADGGIYVSAIEPATGRVLWTGRRYLNNPGDIGRADHERDEKYGAGASDLLSSDGKAIAIGTNQTSKGRFECATGKDTGAYAAPMFGFASAPVAWVGKDSFAGEKLQKGKGMAIVKRGGWKLPVEHGGLMALAAAGDRLVAGISDEAETGTKGEIWLISAADGKQLATLPLAAGPARDGIAVAGGQIFVATQDGSIVCFGK